MLISCSGESGTGLDVRTLRPVLYPHPAARPPVFLLCVGTLTTGSAAADLLDCAVSLAEAAPWQRIILGWVGDGDLRGLLAAQPLPETLSQQFIGDLSADELQDAFVKADVVCFVEPCREAIDTVRATGVPIIASTGNDDARDLLRVGHTGWLFDDRRPRTMLNAIAQALDDVVAITVSGREVVLEPISEDA